VPDHDTKGRGVTAVRPYQIRGRFLTAISLRLEGPADRRMLAELDAQIRQTPQFFAEAPLVVDLEQAAGQVTPADLVTLVEHLRYRRVSVFAVQGGTRDQVEAAATLGLIPVPAGRDAGARSPGKAPDPARDAAPAASPRGASRVVTTPVRSGQTVVAEEGDLIVVGPVGSGAELIAAGHIHVYGTLRGRASAGVFGDETARIFAGGLEAELVSIAGLYRTSESLDSIQQRRDVQVLLRGDRLCVEPVGPVGPTQIKDRSGQ
jgi:septum site-determining protein MinC